MDNDAQLPVGPFRFGVTCDAAEEWAKAEGLPGSPFFRTPVRTASSGTQNSRHTAIPRTIPTCNYTHIQHGR